MGRKAFEINLHNLTTQELRTLRNTTESSYARSILTIIILRIEGKDNEYISADVQKSIPTIVEHVKKWNKLGLASLIDHRGGCENRFTAEMRSDLLNTLNTTKPNTFDLLGHRWTTPLLAEYIYQKYGEKFSDETIRRILKSETYTFKRAQPKPTKADEIEKEAFKKNDTASHYCRKLF